MPHLSKSNLSSVHPINLKANKVVLFSPFTNPTVTISASVNSMISVSAQIPISYSFLKAKFKSHFLLEVFICFKYCTLIPPLLELFVFKITKYSPLPYTVICSKVLVLCAYFLLSNSASLLNEETMSSCSLYCSIPNTLLYV